MNVKVSDWEQLKAIQESLKAVWQSYLTWFTWFFGLNVLAVSWVLTSPESNIRGDLLVPFCILMEICLVVGLLVTWRVEIFTLSCRAQGLKLEKQVGISEGTLVSLIIAPDLLKYAAIGNAVALCGLAGIWVFVLARSV